MAWRETDNRSVRERKDDAERRIAIALRWLEQLAREGKEAPSNLEMAYKLGAPSDKALSHWIKSYLVKPGLLCVSSYGKIRVFSAPDGSWATAQPALRRHIGVRTGPKVVAARKPQPQSKSQGLERKCLTCRSVFSPENRFMFMCCQCRTSAGRVAA